MSAVRQALREGIVAAQARDFDRARELLRQVTSESPQDPVAWFWLAIASPSVDDAVPCLRHVLEIDPSHAQAREALAKLLMTEAASKASSENRAEARALAAEASELMPGDQRVWLSLASLTDDQHERLLALRRAVDIAPDDTQIRTRLRQALLTRAVMIAASDRVQARALLRETAVINPGDQRVWQALANLADSPAEALEALQELLRLSPDHPSGRAAFKNALVGDAESLAAEGRVDEACARWREAIAFTGGDVETWLGLAAITTDQAEAQRAVETAYELNPADPRAIAAIDRLRNPEPDMAAVEPPTDAFARFELPTDRLPDLDLPDDPLEALDTGFGAFAGLAPAAAAPAPAVQTNVPVDVDPGILSETPLASPAGEVPSVQPLQAEAVELAPAPAASGSGTDGSSRRTVMIVDDSPTIRKILGLTLERAGYKVVAEPDGESAIERLLQTVPDLILLDIAMPKLDGYEVCKRIKKDPRTADVPVVMLSGKDAFFDKVKGHMAGAVEYLTKPFETPAVLEVVATHCQPSREAVHG